MTGDGPRFARSAAFVEWTAAVARRWSRTLRLDEAADLVATRPLASLQARSLWPATAGLGCCSLQSLSVRGPRWDPERIGSPFRDEPEGCDVLLLDGALTRANILELGALVSRMAEPRWVMAIGSCAVGGGPFRDGYMVLGGVDEAIEVDVYVPGCPPSAEAVLMGLVKLSELIRREGGPYFSVPKGEGAVL